MLHLLANRACGELFGGGEPAVIYSSLTLLTGGLELVDSNSWTTLLCRPPCNESKPSGIMYYYSLLFARPGSSMHCILANSSKSVVQAGAP
jgi:hypothetical protein